MLNMRRGGVNGLMLLALLAMEAMDCSSPLADLSGLKWLKSAAPIFEKLFGCVRGASQFFVNAKGAYSKGLNNKDSATIDASV